MRSELNKDSRFSKFSGGACPWTPLEGVKKIFDPLHTSRFFLPRGQNPAKILPGSAPEYCHLE